jgi:predicted 3-demethylubiquinone-9 3-methyltransferase (glyoxalase superfamily)
MPTLAKIVPFLWYAKESEEAARFHCSIFPDSRVERVADAMLKMVKDGGLLHVQRRNGCFRALIEYRRRQCMPTEE